MINFQVRYDETLAKWQYQDRNGHWSKPMRMDRLTQALQSELVTLEEAQAKEAEKPRRDPRVWRKSPGVAELAQHVEHEIRNGKVVPRKLSSNRRQAEVEELCHLLDL